MTRITVVVCVAMLVGSCSAAPERPPPSTTTTTTTTVVPVTNGLPRSEPTQVRIPRIAVDSSLIPLGLNEDRTVEVPPLDQPMQAGWYSLAPTPGEPGPSVILGHVDGNHEQGVFQRLHELATGDEILVSRVDGSVVRFTVRQVDQVPKDRFPSEAVYGDTDQPELRLITCGGGFDQSAHSYRDNIIVYATLH